MKHLSLVVDGGDHLQVQHIIFFTSLYFCSLVQNVKTRHFLGKLKLRKRQIPAIRLFINARTKLIKRTILKKTHVFLVVISRSKVQNFFLKYISFPKTFYALAQSHLLPFLDVLVPVFSEFNIMQSFHQLVDVKSLMELHFY